MDDIRKFQLTINVILTITTMGCLFFVGIEKTIYILYIGFPIYYFAILLIFFMDTFNVIFIDPDDNIFFYVLRFFPFYILLFTMCYQKELILELIILFFSLIYTRNITIKDEYRRLISLIVFVYFVRNILLNDLYIILGFLWWYQIILCKKNTIINCIPHKIIILLLYFYMRYFHVKKKIIIGVVFNVLLFSIPFLFYYFFDQRILGIIFINVLLTLLVISRICYIKVIVSPNFALKLTKDLGLQYCDLYFTAITTLLQYEIELLKENLMIENNWIVYIEYEKQKVSTREMIIKDLVKIQTNPEIYKDTLFLVEDLTRYFELAQLPFDKLSFIQNKNKLFNYEIIETRVVFDDKKFMELEDGLLINNDIEVRVKNPIYFVGFFTESKFLLHK